MGAPALAPAAAAGPSLLGLLRRRLPWLIGLPLAAAALAAAIAWWMPPVFVARVTLLPPAPQQGGASALASLGALSGLIGMGSSGGRNSADQYVALMQSATVTDRLVDQFHLMTVYDVKTRMDARALLGRHSRMEVGKRDGLITLEVEDGQAQRAADIANRYVEELRRLTAHLSLSEAQQRRVFFEGQLKQTAERLAQAQTALQRSGFGQGALRAEPKAVVQGYERLSSDIAAAEVRLQILRRSLTDETPDVQKQLALLATLRSQLRALEQAPAPGGGGDASYSDRYREFKYQETLFELYARQFEMARLEEGRDGGLIQVIDPATPPERRASPKRTRITLVGLGLGLLLALAWVLIEYTWLPPRDGRREQP